MEHYENWIDGAFVPAARRMDTSNPYTGEAWAGATRDPFVIG